LIERTSMHPIRVGGMCDTTRIASFKSRALMRTYPPNCCCAEATGPTETAWDVEDLVAPDVYRHSIASPCCCVAIILRGKATIHSSGIP